MIHPWSSDIVEGMKKLSTKFLPKDRTYGMTIENPSSNLHWQYRLCRDVPETCRESWVGPWRSSPGNEQVTWRWKTLPEETPQEEENIATIAGCGGTVVQVQWLVWKIKRMSVETVDENRRGIGDGAYALGVRFYLGEIGVRQKEHGTNLRIWYIEIGDGISSSGPSQGLQPILEESEEPGFHISLPEFELEEIHKLEDMGMCDT
jgi:hypothetical protein